MYNVVPNLARVLASNIEPPMECSSMAFRDLSIQSLLYLQPLGYNFNVKLWPPIRPPHLALTLDVGHRASNVVLVQHSYSTSIDIMGRIAPFGHNTCRVADRQQNSSTIQ